jgi:hypothetical protein
MAMARVMGFTVASALSQRSVIVPAERVVRTLLQPMHAAPHLTTPQR